MSEILDLTAFDLTIGEIVDDEACSMDRDLAEDRLRAHDKALRVGLLDAQTDAQKWKAEKAWALERVAELERERDERTDRVLSLEGEKTLRLLAERDMDAMRNDRDRLQERLDQLAAYGAGSVEELLKMLDALRGQADEAQADALFALSMARRATERLEPLRAALADTEEGRKSYTISEYWRELKEARQTVADLRGDVTDAVADATSARAESARLAELALEAKWLVENAPVPDHAEPEEVWPEWKKRSDAWLSNWQDGAGEEKGNG